MSDMIEISASYDGKLDHDKELQLFDGLKAYAAEHYPAYMVGGSRFEVTGEGAVEKHTHFLKLQAPIVPQKNPLDLTR